MRSRLCYDFDGSFLFCFPGNQRLYSRGQRRQRDNDKVVKPSGGRRIGSGIPALSLWKELLFPDGEIRSIVAAKVRKSIHLSIFSMVSTVSAPRISSQQSVSDPVSYKFKASSSAAWMRIVSRLACMDSCRACCWVTAIAWLALSASYWREVGGVALAPAAASPVAAAAGVAEP